MAVTRTESVIISSTDNDTIAESVRVCGIKVVGGAGGVTFKLRDGASSSGTIFYESTVGNSSEKFEEVEFNCKSGIWIDLTAGSGTIYLYLE